MSHEIRNRILRPPTPEEADRHEKIRQQIDQERPELAQWARAAAARDQERVAVGTVFRANESDVIAAIDDYASRHSLKGREAVVREALARLLGIAVAPR
ncbi:MAG: hypothetical protein ACT4QC_22570 [Planctomycetaceae bacterium]